MLILLSKTFLSYSKSYLRIGGNVSICVRAGLPKPRGVPDTERIKDTKTLDYASTPLDANTLLWPVRHFKSPRFIVPVNSSEYITLSSMANLYLIVTVSVPL